MAEAPSCKTCGKYLSAKHRQIKGDDVPCASCTKKSAKEYTLTFRLLCSGCGLHPLARPVFVGLWDDKVQMLCDLCYGDLFGVDALATRLEEGVFGK